MKIEIIDADKVMVVEIPSGEQGPTGPQGIQGETGVGLEFDWDNTELGIKREDETIYDYTNLKGETGEKGDTGDNVELRVDTGFIQWKETEETDWNNLIALIELKGDKGDKGDAGDEVQLRVHDEKIQWKLTEEINWTDLIALSELKGDKGDTGAKIVSVSFVTDDMVFVLDDASTVTLTDAKTDLKGDKGDTGDAATLDVGTTTTGTAGTDANVVNAGTTSAAVFNFTIPRGDKGETGDQGDKGLDWKGEWTAGTYEKDEAVFYLGSSYIANKQTTETPSDSATDWDLIAQRGVDGEGSGDMLASTYDPTNVNSDAFDYNNFDNTPTFSTGLTDTDGTITTNDNEIDHNNLNNYEAGEHRTIDDEGTGATDLWSANKINTELSDKANIIDVLKIDQETQQPVCNNPLRYCETAGIVEHPREIPDKTYVDAAVTSLGINFYMRKADHDPAVTDPETGPNYKTLTPDPSERESTEGFTERTGIAVDTNYVVQGWMGDGDLPKLVKGTYSVFIQIEKTAGRDVRFFGRLFKRNIETDVETQIGEDSDFTEIVSVNNVRENEFFRLTLSEDVIIEDNERVIGKIYVRGVGTGTNATVKIYYCGDINSYFALPTNKAVLDQMYAPNQHDNDNHIENYLVNINSESVGDLSDVDLTGIDDNKILKWQTDKFVVADDENTTYTASSFDIKDLTDSTNLRTSWSAKWDYDEDTIKAVKVDNAGNADTVNSLTVETAVPVGALFTDTTFSYNSPLSESGGTVSISQANTTTNGYLSSTDWNTFNDKLNTGGWYDTTQNTINLSEFNDDLTYQAPLTFSTGLTETGGTVTTNDSEINHNSLSNYDVAEHRTINDASTGVTDLWSASKINTDLGNKEPTLTKGNLTEATSSVLTISGGNNAVIGTGTTIQVTQANTTTNGYLSSTDWNTFNNKQDALTAGTDYEVPLTVSTGLTRATNTITTNDSEINHNNLNNYDVAEHRTINDAGTGVNDLWSASKINTELDNKADTTDIPDVPTDFHFFGAPKYANAPASPSNGDIYYNTTDEKLYLYDDEWKQIKLLFSLVE